MTYRKRPRMREDCFAFHASVRANLKALMAAYPNEDREERGIGMIRLAKKAGVGTGSVQSILNDPDHSPSLRVLLLLASALGVTVSYLLKPEMN